jgi:hypothetical protein
MIDAKILIVSYEVSIFTKKFKFLKINNKIRYQLWYLIDKDQFYYEKILNGKVVEYHHTKKNFAGSIEILEKLYDRFRLIELSSKNFAITNIFSLADTSSSMLKTIVTMAKDVSKKIDDFNNI